MAKLTTAPDFLVNMSNNDLMNWNLEDEYDDNGVLIREGMITKAVEWGCIDELEALLEETSTKKRYPRVKKPGKKNPNKMTYQADTTQEPVIEVSPLGFFEVKARFIHDICALPSLAKPEEPDFRAKIRAAAAKARAAKEAAAKNATAEEKADAKVAEIFGKK